MSSIIQKQKLERYFNTLLCHKLDQIDYCDIENLVKDCEEILFDLADQLGIPETEIDIREKRAEWQEIQEDLEQEWQCLEA